jgi:hypothetical protein
MQVEEPSMLGPALTLLFKELDKRKSKLTPYEKVLHKELLAAKSGGFVELPRSGIGAVGKGGRLGGLDHEIDASSDFGAPMQISERHGANEFLGDSNFGLQVDLSTDGGVPQLQIGCKKVDCPNKKRK